ncbi:hypothetical protein GWK47_043402 [Chionoecetes opilio]|uniref:Tesmin/TSO1-like CXC domain-containing protein n=1 Tax=Chionoecetes opilio TaxID=41210 RepID=A0A8J5CZM0_CHIOP|nr:hypothetical protein GWK47_043402 [Chionoecetes opilio]
MNKANKAGFSNTSLKELTIPLDLTDQPCSSLVVDGGWLLYMVNWEQGQTWQEIADSYLSYVQCLGSRSQKITVVFDGYSSSPKDHDHIRRTKNSCCDLQIRPDMIHVTPRAKIMDNTHNKSELIHLLSSTFWKRQITVVQCDNDADTSIVRATLAAATEDSVEVQAEDADMLIMLVHHSSSTNHPLFLTTSKGSYDVRRIREALSERQEALPALLSCLHSDYGWTVGVHGYEPVPTLDPMAPEELLQFASCNFNGDCSNRRCSCKKNGVKCISACGSGKGITCKNCIHDGVESGEGSDLDS